LGLPCKYEGSDSLKPRTWVNVTARISVKYHTIYKGIGPILTAIEVTPAEKPEEEVATF